MTTESENRTPSPLQNFYRSMFHFGICSAAQDLFFDICIAESSGEFMGPAFCWHHGRFVIT